jgi:hypothetical protein
MIDFEQKRLVHPRLSRYFERVDEVFSETLTKDGRVVAQFYWRVGYGYRDQGGQTPDGEKSRRKKKKRIEESRSQD